MGGRHSGLEERFWGGPGAFLLLSRSLRIVSFGIHHDPAQRLRHQRLGMHVQGPAIRRDMLQQLPLGSQRLRRQAAGDQLV